MTTAPRILSAMANGEWAYAEDVATWDLPSCFRSDGGHADDADHDGADCPHPKRWDTFASVEVK